MNWKRFRGFESRPFRILPGNIADKQEYMPSLKLISSRPEAGNVHTFVFESSGETWIAGQSQGWSLPHLGGDESVHERWFTVSSAPSEGTMNISTRVSQSLFKQALHSMKPGDIIETHDLGGDFVWEEEPTTGHEVVLVAGGIGITPFRSMLVERDAVGKSIAATLLYFNRNDEIPFDGLLTELSDRHPEFRYVPIVGTPISGDAILDRVQVAQGLTVFLSGPEPMVESVGTELKSRGIHVRQDWFPGYNEQTY